MKKIYKGFGLFKTVFLMVFVFVLFMKSNTFASGYNNYGKNAKPDFTFDQEFKFSHDFKAKDGIMIKLNVKETGVYYFKLPQHFGLAFYNDTEFGYAMINAEEYRIFMFAGKDYYVDIYNDTNNLVNNVNIQMEYFGDNYGRPSYELGVYKWHRRTSGNQENSGSTISEEEYNKLGIYWKNNTLELNNFKAINIEIEIRPVWKKTKMSICYIPSEVLPNKANIRVNVVGDNYFLSDNSISSIGVDSFGTKKIDFTYVGSGSINFDYKGVNPDLRAINGRSITIDGPTINIENKEIECNSLVLLNGELNFKFDSLRSYLINSGTTEFKGGKVSIIGSHNETSKFYRNQVISTKNCVIDGTEFNIKYSNADDKYLYDDIVYVFSCRDEFEMKSGSINATSGTFKVESDSKMSYGLVLVETNNAYVTGGSLCFEYEDNSDIKQNGIKTNYPIIMVDGEFEFKNASVVIVGSKEMIDAYNMIDGKYTDDTDFYNFYNIYLNSTKLDKKTLNIHIGTKVDVNSLGIKLVESKVVYDGKEKKPGIDLKALRVGKDVDVKYSNNINVGKGTVTITGKGYFTGTVKFTFDIVSANADKDNKNNSTLTIKKGNYIYKILSQGIAGKKKGTVEVIGLNKKQLKRVKIAKQIKLNGVTYKVISIGKKAFKGNKNIKSVIIGANVKEIKAYAFANCKKLKKVTIKSKRITKIGKKAFRRKAGKKITFTVPKKVKKKYKKLIKNAKTNKYVIK